MIQGSGTLGPVLENLSVDVTSPLGVRNIHSSLIGENRHPYTDATSILTVERLYSSYRCDCCDLRALFTPSFCPHAGLR